MISCACEPGSAKDDVLGTEDALVDACGFFPDRRRAADLSQRLDLCATQMPHFNLRASNFLIRISSLHRPSQLPGVLHCAPMPTWKLTIEYKGT
ncbi:MAG TPA: hypothetical protein VHP35_03510, partial [Terriglobia bacterium]|nr:hypothetical protein [Terriglobia bacterium]